MKPINDFPNSVMRFCTSAVAQALQILIIRRRQTPVHESRKRKSFTLDVTKCSDVMVGAWKLARVRK